MESRNSPVVEVSEEFLNEHTDLQIGIRVRAAIAHSPAEKRNYEAIVVAKDEDNAQWLPTDVLDADYDFYFQRRISPDDEHRERIGAEVRERLQETDQIILARS